MPMQRMTPEDYLAARQEIVATFGAGARGPLAKRDQALALLAARSGLKQRELGELEHLSKTYIDNRLRFGRFLDVLPSNCGQDAPWRDNLTEGAFRVVWYKTNKTLDENARFEAVTTLLAAAHGKPPTPRGKNPLVKRLLAEFGDGEFHAVRVMATKLDVPQEKLLTTLDGMRLHGFHHTEAERRKAPPAAGGWRYRLRPHRGHVVPYDTLVDELKPLLEQMRYQGTLEQYKLVPFVFTDTVHKIERVLEKLAR
jgi:hypothetical protein